MAKNKKRATDTPYEDKLGPIPLERFDGDVTDKDIDHGPGTVTDKMLAKLGLKK